MMGSLSINCWNCRGFSAHSSNTNAKLEFLETHFFSKPFDVLGLVENHHGSEADFPPLLQEYTLTHHLLHTPMHASDTCGGIVVVISKLFTVLNVTIPFPGRILTATLQHTIRQV